MGSELVGSGLSRIGGIGGLESCGVEELGCWGVGRDWAIGQLGSWAVDCTIVDATHYQAGLCFSSAGIVQPQRLDDSRRKSSRAVTETATAAPPQTDRQTVKPKLPPAFSPSSPRPRGLRLSTPTPPCQTPDTHHLLHSHDYDQDQRLTKHHSTHQPMGSRGYDIIKIERVHDVVTM